MRKLPVILLSVFLISFLASSTLPLREERGIMEVFVNLKVYDEKGALIKEITMRDPLTQAMGGFVSRLFSAASATDESGTSRSLGTGVSGPLYICVGTGSPVSPTYSDYMLVNLLQCVRASQATMAIVGNRGNISLSASFSFSQQYTITEVGLRKYLSYNYLLAHDALSPSITVPAGGKLTVTYIIRINSGV